MPTRESRPLLGVTMGDPCGIGPELVLRLLRSRRARRAARFVVLGNGAVLERVAAKFGLPMPHLVCVSACADLRSQRGTLLIDDVPCPARLAMRGRATAEGGSASVRWVESAIDLAVGGHTDGVVTAPISKEAIHLGGVDWPGHTELLAARTDVPKPVMMMAGGGLRVALVTTHAAMSDVPGLITKDNVLATLRIVHKDLRKYFGLRRPRIHVCGLNPHAGEAGRFGQVEIESITPAIKAARKQGIRCEGPLPADVIFTRRAMSKYDAAVAMYHDQATIPVKLLAVETGVNVTLGLPIVRTSPDHGTAFYIAAKGVADPRSMIEAVVMAAHMARSGCGR